MAKLDLIKYIFEKPFLSGRIARWQVLLSEYDIVYVSEKSIKGSIIVNFLADRANEDYESKRTISNELNPWKMYFDGASNALGHGIEAVLISPNEKYYPATARLNFNCTNNITEYEALVIGLQAAIEMKVNAIEFKEISFNHLPREENQIADALATLAAMFKIKEAADVRPFDLKVREVSAHCLNVEEEVDEAVLPVEVEIPSLRVLMETELKDAEWVRSRYEQLNLIEEKRLEALCHSQMYQRRMMQAYEKKVHPR
ncbi:PREDICTED: uncharacterized protein LOC108661419 [Theobroma cacao]|uniref:Uncharacterized protein LOC108661419 n=1 Tax=Theobroma cacao TaxID=3641 RepID=A0AB32W4N5_THECC|nr:PREDICTED: uncharacterized protein LOC108661419 [Theobroma cacao]